MPHIDRYPDTYAAKNAGSRDASANTTKFGQTPIRADGSGGNDYTLGFVQVDGENRVFLRSIALPAEWGHEIQYPLSVFRDWWVHDFGYDWPGDHRIRPHSLNGYTDARNGNRFVIKMEIDTGDGTRDTLAAITTPFAL